MIYGFILRGKVVVKFRSIIKNSCIISLCLCGTGLLSGCFHYVDVPKEEYLYSEDHSDSKLLIDDNQEIIIDDEKDLLISNDFDSVFISSENSSYSLSTNNITSVQQNRVDWTPTIIYASLGIVIAWRLILIIALYSK